MEHRLRRRPGGAGEGVPGGGDAEELAEITRGAGAKGKGRALASVATSSLLLPTILAISATGAASLLRMWRETRHCKGDA